MKTPYKQRQPLKCERLGLLGPCDLDVENPINLCRPCAILWVRLQGRKKGNPDDAQP